MAQIENIYFTDDGTLVILQSNLLIDLLKPSPTNLILEYGTSRREAKAAAQKLGIRLTVSHEQTKTSQMLLDNNMPHIDDFGLNVFVDSEVIEGEDELIDLRFEIPKPFTND
jgi:hypothetical protein